jgi:hypothetical protein
MSCGPSNPVYADVSKIDELIRSVADYRDTRKPETLYNKCKEILTILERNGITLVIVKPNPKNQDTWTGKFSVVDAVTPDERFANTVETKTKFYDSILPANDKLKLNYLIQALKNLPIFGGKRSKRSIKRRKNTRKNCKSRRCR